MLYSWNDRGRLVSVQNPSSDAVSYEYNENGIRVSSTINGVKTSYLLDANRDYAQVLEEYDNSGTQVSYLYGHDLISQNRNGAKSFYLYDGLGSTKALTDASGVVTDRYIYDAYGNVLSSIGTTQNSYLYSGEQFDAGAGQYYLRDRYYNQAVGRFTRSDTWEGNTNNPLSLNKYLYANGNAINNIDPSGLFSISAVSAANVIIGVLAAIAFPTFSPILINSFFSKQMNSSDDVIVYIGWGKEFPTTWPFGHAFISVDGLAYSYPGTPIPQLNIPPQSLQSYTAQEIDRYGYTYTKYSLNYSFSEKQELKMRLNLLKQSSYKMGGYVTGFPGEDARNCKTYVVDSLLSKGGIFDVLIKGQIMPFGLGWSLDVIDILSNGSLVKRLGDRTVTLDDIILA
jgi:RHS repeat-associated protein